MNVYKAIIAIDDFFSIMHNKVPFFSNLLTKNIFWTPVRTVICMSLSSVLHVQ